MTHKDLHRTPSKWRDPNSAWNVYVQAHSPYALHYVLNEQPHHKDSDDVPNGVGLPLLQDLRSWALALGTEGPTERELEHFSNQKSTASNKHKWNTSSLNEEGEKHIWNFGLKRNTATCTYSQRALSPFDSEYPLHWGCFQPSDIQLASLNHTKPCFHPRHPLHTWLEGLWTNRALLNFSVHQSLQDISLH